jgi:hypothetical protein
MQNAHMLIRACERVLMACVNDSEPGKRGSKIASEMAIDLDGPGKMDTHRHQASSSDPITQHQVRPPTPLLSQHAPVEFEYDPAAHSVQTDAPAQQEESR